MKDSLKRKVICTDCGEQVELSTVDDEGICEDCIFDRFYFKCVGCEEYFHEDDLRDGACEHCHYSAEMADANVMNERSRWK